MFFLNVRYCWLSIWADNRFKYTENKEFNLSEVRKVSGRVRIRRLDEQKGFSPYHARIMLVSPLSAWTEDFIEVGGKVKRCPLFHFTTLPLFFMELGFTLIKKTFMLFL